MKRSIPSPTKAERERWDRFREIGCIASREFLEIRDLGYEIHHLNDGTDSMGHWYTIPLIPYYHRGVIPLGTSPLQMFETYGPSLAHGSKRFLEHHKKTDLDLWRIVQKILGLDDKLPDSKILPRRCA